jgi:hypothetical protein
LQARRLLVGGQRSLRGCSAPSSLGCWAEGLKAVPGRGPPTGLGYFGRTPEIPDLPFVLVIGRGFEQQDLVRRNKYSLVARALVDCGIHLVKARQTIIWKQIPARFRGDELVVLRSDTRIGIQSSESHRHLGPVRPSPTEETRPADRAEGLHGTIVIGTVDPNETARSPWRQAEAFATTRRAPPSTLRQAWMTPFPSGMAASAVPATATAAIASATRIFERMLLLPSNGMRR